MDERIKKIKENRRLSACADYVSILKQEGVKVDGLQLTNAFLDDIKTLMDISKSNT